jgi:uncharacterized protein (TIGR00290 family)
VVFYSGKPKGHLITPNKERVPPSGIKILDLNQGNKSKKKKKKALLSWSGGKDSSLCLYEMLRNESRYKDEIEINSLLTTLTRDYNRISMHGVRHDLLIAQSSSLGIPIEEVWIPSKASNEIYQTEMIKVLTKWRRKENDDDDNPSTNASTTMVFGDLFLADIRAYREKFLQSIGFECLFPIWGRDTKELGEFFIDSGFKAIICTVDPKKLDARFCGRSYDRKFLSEIPITVDPCGENGEFHTFVYDGPIFKNAIKVRVEEIVEREGFWFADILRAEV